MNATEPRSADSQDTVDVSESVRRPWSTPKVIVARDGADVRHAAKTPFFTETFPTALAAGPS
jgi:hypothetical protein